VAKRTDILVCIAFWATSAAGDGIEMGNWRRQWTLVLSELDMVYSSPSGLFWDLLYTSDPRLATVLAWPDSGSRAPDHWRLEPSLIGLADSRAFVDSNTFAGRFEVTNDVRYGRLFTRQRLEVDSRAKSDSLYIWKTDRVAAGRIEEAWLQVAGDHWFIRFGRMGRSWGPFADQSLLLSAVPHTYDALEWQVWGRFFEFRHLFAAFNYSTSSYDTGDRNRLVQRYLTAHALSIMVGDWVSIGIFESVLFGREGLPDWQYVNPVSIYTVTNTNNEGSGNLMLGLQWRVHPFTKNVELLGQVLVDDLQVDNETAGDQEPPHFGLDVAVHWRNPFPLRFGHALRLRYTYLSRWLYLVSRPNTEKGERYTHLEQGLGADRNDGDRWDLGFSAAGHGGWFGRAGAVYARNGGNTLTSPWNTGDTAHPNAGYNGYRTETSLRSDTVEQRIEVYAEAGYAWRGYVSAAVRGAARWVEHEDNTPGDGYEFKPWIAAEMSIQYPFFRLVFGERSFRGRKARAAEAAPAQEQR
jgi:hypothetical protein